MEHDWRRVTAPNGDQGWQCARCKLTAITLPVHDGVAECPATADIPHQRAPTGDNRNYRAYCNFPAKPQKTVVSGPY
jgi:hypothetical protein